MIFVLSSAFDKLNKAQFEQYRPVWKTYMDQCKIHLIYFNIIILHTRFYQNLWSYMLVLSSSYK
jgi:hypothetical protein